MSSVIYVQCENFCSHRYFHPSYGASPPGHPLSHYSFSPSCCTIPFPLVLLCSLASLRSLNLSSPLLPGFRCSVPLGESRRFERERKREKLRGSRGCSGKAARWRVSILRSWKCDCLSWTVVSLFSISNVPKLLFLCRCIQSGTRISGQIVEIGIGELKWNAACLKKNVNTNFDYFLLNNLMDWSNKSVRFPLMYTFKGNVLSRLQIFMQIHVLGNIIKKVETR